MTRRTTTHAARWTMALLTMVLLTRCTSLIASEPPAPPDDLKSRVGKLKYIEGKVTLLYSTNEPYVYVSLDTANAPILYYRIELSWSTSPDGRRVPGPTDRMFETAQLAIDQNVPLGVYYEPPPVANPTSNTARAVYLLVKPKS